MIMTKFKVAITQNLSQVFTVDAHNAEQAVNKISEAFENGVITLNAPDFYETDFIVI